MEGNTADMSLEDYLQLINVGFTYEHGSYPISWMVQGYIFFRKPGMETLSYTLWGKSYGQTKENLPKLIGTFGKKHCKEPFWEEDGNSEHL